MDGETWHLVEARRDDGAPTIFRIRELDPRPELSRIFVVEMPYEVSETSLLPDASGYRRLAQFEEQWLAPACTATGYEQVGLKIEDGSFFHYLYGNREPNDLIARLAPFDADLGFYDDVDPTWGEYATLRDLLEQAKALPREEVEPAVTAPARAATTPAKQPARKKPAAKKPAAKKQAAAKKKPAPKKRATKKPARRR